MTKQLLLFVLVLTVSSQASATIKHNILDPAKTLNTPMQTIPLDIDGNGVVDFQLFYDAYLGDPFLHVNVPASLQSKNKVVVTGEKNICGKDLVAGLTEGTPINASSLYNGPISGNGPLFAQPESAGNDILEGRQEIFVGVKFDRAGRTHYGYIALEVDQQGTSATIFGYAWEDEAMKAIPAGEFADEIVPVTSITIASSTGPLEITTKSGTLQLHALIMPDNASVKDVHWSVTDPTLAEVTQTGLVTAKKDGLATIVATATDGSGIIGSNTVAISGQSTASVDVLSNDGVRVMRLGNTITISQRASLLMTIDIVDINGRVVKTMQGSSNEMSLSLADLTVGCYFIRCENSEEVRMEKVVRY